MGLMGVLGGVWECGVSACGVGLGSSACRRLAYEDESAGGRRAWGGTSAGRGNPCPERPSDPGPEVDRGAGKPVTQGS